MYQFYETQHYLHNTSMTRRVDIVTTQVVVTMDKNGKKHYKRTCIRKASVIHAKLQEGGRKYLGSRVQNYALNLHFTLGSYWPLKEENYDGHLV